MNQSHTELAARARWLAETAPPTTSLELVESWRLNAAQALRQCAAALESPERVLGETKLRSIGWGTFRANGSLIEIVDTQVEAERYTHESESFAEVFVSDNCATPSPQAERVPLSETQIWAMQCALPDGQWMHEEASAAFESGVRSAERAHGIITKESST